MASGSQVGGHIRRVDAGARSTASMSPIRGRIEPLRVIDDLLTDLSRGRGAVLIVEGPPGIGKSRLLAELGIRAARVGAQPLAGRAFEDQQTVPFGPLLSATLHASPAVVDADALKDLSIAGDQGFWIVQQLQLALSAATTSRPLLIVVDDVHWADPGTLMALRGLVSGLSELPVLWALATRPADSRPSVRETLDSIAALTEPRAHLVRLAALTDDAVAEIAADVLCAHVDETLLQLTQRTHGNPFLVLELLRGLREEGRIRVADSKASATGRDLPYRLTDNMTQRLDRLSEGARRVVQVASVLPARFSTALLTGMLGLAAAQLLASVAEATRADLLAEDGEHFRFRHDLLRQAARQSIPHALRRALERESATLLLEQGAGPVEVAAQLARSADVGDTEAVTALRAAAATLVRSDPSGAADLSLRAVELVRSDDPQRPAVVAETAERLRRASRWNEVQQLAATTVTADMPGEEEALIRLSLSTVNDGSHGARIEQNRRGLELDGVTDVTRARHLGYLAHNLLLAGETQPAREAAEQAVAAAALCDDVYAGLLGEITLAMIECAMGMGRSCLNRVYSLLAVAQHADEKIAALAICHGSNLLMVLGELDTSKALCDVALAAARDAHYDEAIAVFTHLLAMGEYAGGRLAAVQPLIDSLPEDERCGMHSINAMLGATTLGALSGTVEDVPQQRLVATAVRPGLAGGPADRRIAIGALGQIAWQRGDLDEAARWLGAEFNLLGPPSGPTHLDQIVIAARIVATSGDAGLRERVMATMAMLESDDDPLPVFAGVALHIRGLLDHDLDALTSASTILADTARPLLWASAMEDAGVLMARRGMRDEAIEQLSAAFDAFLRCGSTADGRRVSRALGELGVTRRVVRQRYESGWESLTASEQRVFELVAAGATNREVAQELSVSPHTVNTHLRRVFAKLDVHSRAELITLANDAAPPTPPSAST